MPHTEVGVNKRFNTLRPRQNGRHFADDIFKRIFLIENVKIPIKNSLKFVREGSFNNNSALAQIMAWRRPDDKPLSEPMMVRLPTHICVTRPQWVNCDSHIWFSPAGLWLILDMIITLCSLSLKTWVWIPKLVFYEKYEKGYSISRVPQQTKSSGDGGHILRTPCQPPAILSSTPQMTPVGLVMAGCCQINYILTHIGRRNSIRI